MSVSRRRMLTRLGAAVTTVSFGHLWAPCRARASDLSLSDRIDLLYSNQFHFNERGEPQITVGLMEGQTSVRLSAEGGLRVLPSGDGGTAIEGGTRFEITLAASHPARQSFALVLEELDHPDARRLDAAIRRWRARGFDPHDHEVGTVFGVGGHVLDHRRVLITAERFSSEDEALRRARALETRYGVPGKVHPIVHERSRGGLQAVDLQTGVTVRADGVLWFAPRTGKPITVHDLLSGTTMGPGSRSERQYWGSIYVAIDRLGKLAVVNLVSESELLAGLVPAEIFASAPMEALRAQAVAARGQLVGKIGSRHAADPYLLCGEQHCQVYAGRMREHPRTTKAVQHTSGWVAMRPGGRQLVDTVYSANCGGHTENNEHVWPGAKDPQLRGRPDPLISAPYKDGIDDAELMGWLRAEPRAYCRPPTETGRNSYRWQVTLDPAAIAASEHLGTAIGEVRHLEVLSRGRSGRATALRVVGSSHAVEIAGELRIRRALGGLRSSMFVVLSERDKFGRLQLLGGGHGHGVGLCQHGAMGMARAGKSYSEILGHYYAGSKPTKLW